MRTRTLFYSVCVLGALFLAGCGGDDSEATAPVLLEPLNNQNNQTENNANNANNSNNANNANNSNNANNANNVNNINNVNERSDLEVILEETVSIQGSSMEFSFDVPDDAQSVTISVAGASPQHFTLSRWTQSDDTDLVNRNWLQSDQGAPQLCLGCPQRITAMEGAFAAMVPGNPSVQIVPGTHTVQIYAFERNNFNVSPWTGQADVWVTVKRAETQPESGVLDLNLFFTGAQGLTADSAPDDAEFQQMLEDAENLYAQANITFGQITYNDIDSRFQVVENASEPGSDLIEMFKLSSDAPPGVNVFFCEELTTGGPLGGFGILLGIAGNIPGPVYKNGTPRSGVALALKRDPQVPTPLHKVFAHEIGHFLGLFHTSEQDLGFGPRIHDQLDDTNNDDTTLLMHAQGNGETLTESQGRVMRLNPWVAQP